ncbi:MAG: fluoride efflux transporter CrcB [Alphaproteobacteria bacterium]
MKLILAIAAGGAIGAVARHYVAFQVSMLLGRDFPWGTLAVNILGSFILGTLIELMALVWSPSQEIRALLTVGMLGAFTTFSTFSLDTVLLIERGDTATAMGYIATSLLLSVGALFLGLRLARLVIL